MNKFHRIFIKVFKKYLMVARSNVAKTELQKKTRDLNIAQSTIKIWS